VNRIFALSGLSVEVDTAGSREIATSTDLKSYDFAFPSSAPAAEENKREHDTRGVLALLLPDSDRVIPAHRRLAPEGWSGQEGTDRLLVQLIPRKGGVMSAPEKYPPEVRDRAVRIVDDLLADDQLQLSVTGACHRVWVSSWVSIGTRCAAG
jgi:hypothetical protein